MIDRQRPKSKQAKKEVSNNTPLRKARSCYGHLAGVAGVSLFEQMLDKNWFKPTMNEKRQYYQLTKHGIISLLNSGLERKSITTSKKKFAYACPDWTENGYHLGGQLGKIIFNYLLAHRIMSKTDTRAVTINEDVGAKIMLK